MKKIFFLIILFSLLLIPVFQAAAQQLSTTEPTNAAFDTTGFPQWAKDLRRWEIIAFGTYPFSLFFVTFTMDMIRWNNANSMDMSEEGRRYAPWPLKSAGALEMSSHEFRSTLVIAAGVSITLALIDLFLVLSKRNAERRRLESIPSGSFEIERKPLETLSDDEASVEAAEK